MELVFVGLLAITYFTTFYGRHITHWYNKGSIRFARYTHNEPFNATINGKVIVLLHNSTLEKEIYYDYCLRLNGWVGTNNFCLCEICFIPSFIKKQLFWIQDLLIKPFDFSDDET